MAYVITFPLHRRLRSCRRRADVFGEFLRAQRKGVWCDFLVAGSVAMLVMLSVL